ncbi:hypothetical protein BY458DRAFT_513120 [Sporodiniella umbellata]|nr:hypothetical protein BY458DRAFT_513120 [Sporodiniella umbellata]
MYFPASSYQSYWVLVTAFCVLFVIYLGFYCFQLLLALILLTWSMIYFDQVFYSENRRLGEAKFENVIKVLQTTSYFPS